MKSIVSAKCIDLKFAYNKKAESLKLFKNCLSLMETFISRILIHLKLKNLFITARQNFSKLTIFTKILI